MKLLSAPIDLSAGTLKALADKHAEVLENGDDFWPKTVDAVMSRKEVQEALEKRVRSNFSDNRDLYARLTHELPTLADALAKTLSFDEQGMVAGKPIDEVLRRMRKAPPTAQRALIARATDPSNGASDELVERIVSFPEIVAGSESYVLGLRSSNKDSRTRRARPGNRREILLKLAPELLGRPRCLDPSKVRLQAARLHLLSLLIMTINEFYNTISINYRRNWVMMV